jgi:hypothetical protein
MTRKAGPKNTSAKRTYYRIEGPPGTISLIGPIKNGNSSGSDGKFADPTEIKIGDFVFIDRIRYKVVHIEVNGNRYEFNLELDTNPNSSLN